jgi:hypothetical protein
MTAALKFQRGHNVAMLTTIRIAQGQHISYHDYDCVIETPVGYVLVTGGSGMPVLRMAVNGNVYTRRIARRTGIYSARGLVCIAGRFAREVAKAAKYRTVRGGRR